MVVVAYISVVLSSHRKIIEAQKTKLAEVIKSSERYKALFDHSLAGMMKFSAATWEVNDVNEALLSMLNCSSEKEVQQSLSSIPAALLDPIKTALQRNGVVSECELQVKTAEGKKLWLLFSAKLIDGDSYAHGVLVDITKRKSVEERVKEQAALLDETQDAIIVMEENGEITFWNRGAETMYGWTQLEAVNSKLQSLLYSHEREKEYREAMNHARPLLEWNDEQHHKKKDGKEILVESRWLIVDHTNRNRRTFLIVNTDITNKKRMEAKFIEAQRMESIALLTGGIAHDLQNILAPVAMSIGLLRNELKNETSLNVLRAVEESAQSGLQLVKNILTYGKGIRGERVELNISALLNHVLEIIERGLPTTVVVRKGFADTNWIVRGDLNQLKQVFLNISVNARDAMPRGGVLGIDVSRSSFEEKELSNYPYAQAGCFVVVRISDTGVGIPPEQIETIFEPFFTTKEGGEGTGLGLSIVHGIVKSHGGFVTVESTLNRGTTFTVHLPSA